MRHITKITKIKKYRKANIPKELREQVWLQTFGKIYENSCHIKWCSNIINVFDFQVGHDIPESKGGKLTIDNLKPICSRCNLSMGNNYSIEEWQKFNGDTISKPLKCRGKKCIN